MEGMTLNITNDQSKKSYATYKYKACRYKTKKKKSVYAYKKILSLFIDFFFL